jgi:hypothetical protein
VTNTVHSPEGDIAGASNNLLVTVSSGFQDMFDNWWHYFSLLKLSLHVIVVAEDNATYTRYKNNKGLGAIRAKIGPTSDADKIFSKMYSQYVLFRNKYS